MVRLLSKLFNIRPAEWPRLLLLYLMFFVFVLGWTWGSTILEAAFLEQQQLGLGALPWFFVIKGIIAIPAIAIYAAFVDRVPNDRLLIAILMVSVFGIIAGLLLLNAGRPQLAYPLLYLIIFVPLDDIFAAHWYTYLGDFYDTRSAKRIVPILVTAVIVGGSTAGLTMPLLNHLFRSPNSIILVWLATLLLVALLAWFMPHLFKQAKTAREQPRSPSSIRSLPSRRPPGGNPLLLSAQLANIREGYRYVLQSPFLRWLALSALSLMLLLTFLQYQTSQILLLELGTLEKMSNFIGRLTGITYLLLLPLQLFLLSRIISRIGLGNANLIYPTGNLAISTSLILAPSLPTTALAYFSRTNFYGIIGYTIESLLYNAVPLRVKGRARAFISGLIVPVGSLLGGLLLLSPLVKLAWFLPIFIGLLAVAHLLNALVIRRQYSQALIKMLEQEDFSFLLSSTASNLSVSDPTTLTQLQKKLAASSSYEFTLFMAKLISQMGGSNAIPILGQAARATTDDRSRAAIIDVLVAADMQGDAVRQLYTDFLTDPDGRVRQAAVTGLEQLTGPQDKQFLALALTMVTDPEPEVRAKLLPALLRSPDPLHQAAATASLNEFLSHEQPHQQAQGIHVLQQTGDLRFIQTLLEYLADPADEVRLAAALAVETLIQEKMSIPSVELILAKLSPLVHDPVERVRQAALIVLGRLGLPESHQALVSALADPSPQVRTTAVTALAQVGKAVIPTIHPMLNSANLQLRKMTTVVLSRINRREFGPLVETHITGNLLTIYQNHGRLAALAPCGQWAGITVMQSALREQNQHLLNEIFYLLTAIHESEAVRIVAESLKSETARIRANAVEALESLTTPQTARLIAPLFESEAAPTQLLQISRDTWDMLDPTTAKTIRQLLTDAGEPLFRALITFALGEMGATLIAANGSTHSIEAHQSVSQPIDVLPDLEKPDLLTSPNKPERRRERLSRSLDLLNTLAGANKDGQPPPEQAQAKPEGRQSRPVDLFTLPEIEDMLEASFADPTIDVRLAARAAKQLMSGQYAAALVKEEGILLSAIEKIIFLKEVPFFQGMTVDQLRVLADVCEEELFEEDARIFNEGDQGGALYVVVSGRVAIEQEKRKGSFARLATIEAHSYFGEMNLFDNSPRSATAIALQDTLILRLRREPLIALARQHPDLSLELINVLSQRLREANDRVAELTRTRPRELHKLFDKFD